MTLGECGKVPSEKELNKQLKSCAKGTTNCKLLQWMFEESGNGKYITAILLDSCVHIYYIYI